MSTNEAGHVVITPIRPGAAKNKPPQCDKNVEIEKLERLLHHVIDRLKQLKSK